MQWLMPAVGAVVVFLVLRDIFHTLWHPHGHGSLSQWVMRTTWRVFRRLDFRGGLTGLTGPFGTVVVVMLWTALIVAGWALVYWPGMPDAFSFDPGLDGEARSNMLDALYLSLVVVATLGFGDIVPEAGWLRAVTPVQALMGFAILSAAVSWVTQLMPALQRRRALASRLANLRGSGTADAVGRLGSPAVAGLLDSLTTGVLHARVDLVQHSESYYFHDREDSMSLAATLGYAVELAERGSAAGREDVRLAGTALAGALEDLAAVISRQYAVPGGTPAEVFAAYAADHGQGGGSRGAVR